MPSDEKVNIEIAGEFTHETIADAAEDVIKRTNGWSNDQILFWSAGGALPLRLKSERFTKDGLDAWNLWGSQGIELGRLAEDDPGYPIRPIRQIIRTGLCPRIPIDFIYLNTDNETDHQTNSNPVSEKACP